MSGLLRNEKTEIRKQIVRRRNTRKAAACVLGVFVAIFVFTFLVQVNRNYEMVAEAASLDEFDAGYIISDWQMGNYNSMSESQIQDFLTSKNSCSNRDYDYYLRLSRNSGYTWHWKDDHFVCLSEELFGDGEVIGSGETAAHILWQTAQDYRINPQALIVLLQKETGLITDPIPNNGDYRKATGYGCPDTAPCSAEYYGFKNQVRRAAALYRTVLDGGWTNYPLGENYIQYNPNADCGGSVVNIRSLATSALYRYTPYQPNQGALDAGYGTAYCGAYGNRNFYLYFQDWFGGITNDYSEKLGRTIPDGTYQITPRQNGSIALDIYGGIVPNMKAEKIILYNKKERDTDNQTFEIKYNSVSGYYNIYNATSGLYLSKAGDAIMVNGDDGCERNWNIRRNKDGYYELLSACNGMRITMGDSLKFSNIEGQNTQWKLFEVSKETHALKDGEYQISTALSDKYVIDIEGGVSKEMSYAEIDLWVKKSVNKEDSNQVFDVKYNSDMGYYTIVNKFSGLSLDVYNENVDNGTKIIMWKQNDGCNQRWMIRKMDDGDYEILSMCTGKSLDVPNSKLENGQDVIIYDRQKSKNQRWVFNIPANNEESIEDIEYMISVSNNPAMVLDISGGVKKDSKYGEMIIYSQKNSENKNQIFKLKKDSGSKYYYIYNPESDLYLDVYNGGLENGSRVILWPQNNGCNQKWDLIKNVDSYQIISACSGRVLDVEGGKILNTTPIIIYDNHRGSNQKWLLQKSN